jgi:hypothetical protein
MDFAMMQKSRPTKRAQRKPTKPRPYASRPKLSFTQREVQRALRAVKAEDVPIAAVEVNPQTGVIRLIPGTPDAANDVSNPWDKAIDNAAHKERTP